MNFHARGFQTAKDFAHPEACQDAWGIDLSTGVAVIADGVSSAIFSGQWACILAQAVIDQPPNPYDPAGFGEWLGIQRMKWHELVGGIDTGTLAWHQTAKLASGAFTTLLWTHVAPIESPEAGSFGSYRLTGFAIGDSCLFQFRHGEMVRSFPLENSAQLEALPVVLGSIDLGNDHMMQFASLDIECAEGDQIILATDAVSEWIFNTYEQGEMIDWSRYWSISEEEWKAEIEMMRENRIMRYDDATMLLLGLASASEADPSEVVIDQTSDAPSSEGQQVTRKWWNPFKK